MDLWMLEGRVAVPVTMCEWHLQDIAVRRVADDTIGDVRVSTIFLGIDHGWGEGPPQLFETMVFGGPHDGDQERYASWEEAAEGHARIVAGLRAETE